MSTKLVKRLLQTQLEPPSTTTKKRPRNNNNNNNNNNNDANTIASPDMKRAHFLETTILGVDRAMSTHGEISSSKALRRMVVVQNNTKATTSPSKVVTTKKNKKKSMVVVVGNARASSSSTLAKHEPTFRKRQHAKEVKKAMLAKIAKLLDQGKKKKTTIK